MIAKSDWTAPHTQRLLTSAKAFREALSIAEAFGATSATKAMLRESMRTASHAAYEQALDRSIHRGALERKLYRVTTEVRKVLK